MRRLLTIGHSYVVALNRRLAHEMALAGAGEWDVTVAAPVRYRGDLRPIALEPIPGEASRLVPLRVHFDRMPHLMWYGAGLRALLREPWDVVHCWEEPYVLATARIAALIPRPARFVFATFQNIPKRYPPPLASFERRTLRRADGWIAFGESVRAAQVERREYAALPVRVIPPGVDAAAFRPDAAARARRRHELGWSDDVPVVGFVGRFIEAKGISTLIEALGGLDRPWRVLFVGGGPEERRIAAFAEGRSERVRIVTGVSHADVPSWLNAMDVLCAPSRTTAVWREQFGRMLIEAMACGIPVVASRSGEIPHVVGSAGLLVEEDDGDAWRSGIANLLESPARRGELSARGLVRVAERFTWAAAARAHLEFFDSLS